MANSVDPDQTAPIAVCAGSTLFASILNWSVMLGAISNAADNFNRQHFQMHFFLGPLRVKTIFGLPFEWPVKRGFTVSHSALGLIPLNKILFKFRLINNFII